MTACAIALPPSTYVAAEDDAQPGHRDDRQFHGHAVERRLPHGQRLDRADELVERDFLRRGLDELERLEQVHRLPHGLAHEAL